MQLTEERRQEIQKTVYAQLQHMLRGQNDYSIPEKQQELRSFVGELDANAFKDSNGSEDAYVVTMSKQLKRIQTRINKQGQNPAQQAATPPGAVQPPQPAAESQASGNSGVSAGRSGSVHSSANLTGVGRGVTKQHQQLMQQQQQAAYAKAQQPGLGHQPLPAASQAPWNATLQPRPGQLTSSHLQQPNPQAAYPPGQQLPPGYQQQQRPGQYGNPVPRSQANPYPRGPSQTSNYAQQQQYQQPHPLHQQPQAQQQQGYAPHGARNPQQPQSYHQQQQPQQQPGTAAAYQGHTGGQYASQNGVQYPSQARPQYPTQAGAQYPSQTGAQYPSQTRGQFPPQTGAQYPSQPGGQYPSQNGAQYPPQNGAQYPSQARGQYPSQTAGRYPSQPGGQYAMQSGGQYPVLSAGRGPIQPSGGLGGRAPGQNSQQPYAQQFQRPPGGQPSPLRAEPPAQPMHGHSGSADAQPTQEDEDPFHATPSIRLMAQGFLASGQAEQPGNAEPAAVAPAPQAASAQWQSQSAVAAHSRPAPPSVFAPAPYTSAAPPGSAPMQGYGGPQGAVRPPGVGPPGEGGFMNLLTSNTVPPSTQIRGHPQANAGLARPPQHGQPPVPPSGDYTQMYWDLMAKGQRETIPIFDKCKESWQRSSNPTLIKKMQSIYQIIPRLKISPSDPKYAGRRWSKAEYEHLQNALKQLQPYAQSMQAMEEGRLSGARGVRRTTASSGAAAPGTGGEDVQSTSQTQTASAASLTTGQANATSKAAASVHSSLDDRQRLAVAALEFQKAGAGAGGVRRILEMEEPVAPETPSHLLAPGLLTDSPSRATGKRKFEGIWEESLEAMSPTSVLDPILEPRSGDDADCKPGPHSAERKALLEAEYQEAVAALGADTMLVMCGGSGGQGGLAVHVAPNHPQHALLSASVQLPAAHPDGWRVLTILPGELGQGVVFHHSKLQDLEFHRASIARERFEAGLSELARAPKVLDLALAWQAALAAAGGGKDI